MSTFESGNHLKPRIYPRLRKRSWTFTAALPTLAACSAAHRGPGGRFQRLAASVVRSESRGPWSGRFALPEGAGALQRAHRSCAADPRRRVDVDSPVPCAARAERCRNSRPGCWDDPGRRWPRRGGACAARANQRATRRLGTARGSRGKWLRCDPAVRLVRSGLRGRGLL